MITTKQRAYLRGLANKEPSILQIGKNGIDENVAEQFREALDAREIVKGTCLETSGMTSREAVTALAELCDAEIVQVIGTKFVLYRKGKKPKIVLP